MNQPENIRLSFHEESSHALASLLWGHAPNTCAAIAKSLPITGQVHQAIYSGSESVLLLNDCLRLEKENATSDVKRGDLAFVWLPAGANYGVSEDFAELCWFYDHDAQPRMWEGPVDVNLFARIHEPADDFYAVCRRIRRQGVKPMRIEAV